MKTAKPFLIVQCEMLAEACPALHAVAGDTDDLFKGALGAGDHPVAVARVCRDEPLPDPADVAGVLVSGSNAMVVDPDPWIARTAAWLGGAHAGGTPILGVCFGHQLIAHALGGTVRQTRTSPEFATVAIDRAAAESDDPLLGFLPRRFVAQACHFQTVTEPPPESRILARNGSGIQALRFGPATWGVQFHPEFSDEHLRLILDDIADPAARGIDIAAGRAGAQPTPEMTAVLPRFRAFALTRGRSAA